MTKYNKLVRDKIPEMCLSTGDIPVMRHLQDDDAYLQALTNKLGEEAAEVKETPTIEELADVVEVVHAICKAIGCSPEDVEQARLQKREERGGFEDRVFLVRTVPAQTS